MLAETPTLIGKNSNEKHLCFLIPRYLVLKNIYFFAHLCALCGKLLSMKKSLKITL